ncbi:MAG: lipoprotein-releasing system ATP-binding protein LolD [Candidatus Marinimicrobia bacterium]|nr:lipoprotein-releasing system ATP-binding protein LolD [Candidatus Neomarinimicrobiota bacterium]
MLESKKLSKSYSNGNKQLEVIKNLNLKVNTAEIITIVGNSGSGKSTLLNLLGGLDSPDSGDLNILGKDILKLNNTEKAEFRNKDLGFIFQFHHLLPEFTAYENVLIPSLINDDSQDKEVVADELFDYVNLRDRKKHYPSELSGGERLRVAVLRALINQPPLILADEPTGNLDADNSKRLMQLFKKINSDFNQTFIITTHNPEVARIGTRCLKLTNGRLRKNSI